MLLCGPFAVKGVEVRNFKLRQVFDRVPLYQIKFSGSHLLLDGCDFKGSNLLLKSLHPVTSITISSLTFRLYLIWVVGLGMTLDFIVWFMRKIEADGAVRVGALLVLAMAC